MTRKLNIKVVAIALSLLLTALWVAVPFFNTQAERQQNAAIENQPEQNPTSNNTSKNFASNKTAYELFFRTVGANKARGLIKRAGLNDQQIKNIYDEAKSLNELYQNGDKRKRELRESKTISTLEKQNGFRLVREMNEANLMRVVTRYLPQSLGDSGWQKFQNFIETEVKPKIQSIPVASLNKNNAKNNSKAQFVKTSGERSKAQTGDNIHLYSAAWQDGDNVFGAGTLIEDSDTYTSYYVTTTVNSSGGRTNTTNSDWSYASISNNTGISIGVEDGTYNIQATFEADAGGYYDEFGNYYSNGTYNVGSSSSLVNVPPTVTISGVIVTPPQVNHPVQTDKRVVIGIKVSSTISVTDYLNACGANSFNAPVELSGSNITGNPDIAVSGDGRYSITVPKEQTGLGSPYVTKNTGETPEGYLATVKRNSGIGSRTYDLQANPNENNTDGMNNMLFICSEVGPPAKRNLASYSGLVRPTIVVATPTPASTPVTGGGSGGGEVCDYNETCNGDTGVQLSTPDVLPEGPVSFRGICNSCSPIVIDVAGNGYDLTGDTDGVNFDLNGDGISGKIAWTSANSDDAWLVLDRNDDGKIDKGAELFGNYTPQPTPPSGTEKNGFIALAEYDKTGNDGNADGKITRKDRIFTKLRLWQDKNHNGVSEPEELRTLGEKGVVEIGLNYARSMRRDLHGNEFRYRSTVKFASGTRILGHWAWDVYLTTPR